MDLSKASEQILEDIEAWKIIIFGIKKKSYILPTTACSLLASICDWKWNYYIAWA